MAGGNEFMIKPPIFRSKLGFFSGLITILFLTSSILTADQIELNNGVIYNGNIIYTDKDNLQIEIGKIWKEKPFDEFLKQIYKLYKR